MLVSQCYFSAHNVVRVDNGGGEERRDSHVQYNNTATFHVAGLWPHAARVS